MSTVTFYKLKHATDITKECYVGCTKNMICRKSVHKYDCNTPNNKKKKQLQSLQIYTSK